MSLPQGPEGPASLAPAVRYFYRSPEVSSVARRETAWLQKALSTVTGQKVTPDGIAGPRTAEQVRRFQLERGLNVTGVFDAATRRLLKTESHNSPKPPPRRVLLIQPSVEPHSDTYATAGGNLSALYREADPLQLVQHLGRPDASRLQSLLEKYTPDVMHVCASVHESPSIGLYLDFDGPKSPPSGGGSSSGTDGVSVTALDRMLGLIQERAGTRPHLVLDVLGAGGRTEILIQLLMRNALASQLMSFGHCASVIATGLCHPSLDLRDQTIHALISALGRGAGCGDAVNALRSAGMKSPEAQGRKRFAGRPERFLETLVATAGTALFTDEPLA